jgi:FAD/FMN-containing dehydrogenase
MTRTGLALPAEPTGIAATPLPSHNLVEADLVDRRRPLLYGELIDGSGTPMGLRGGGGNFGVVTRFGFRLHDVVPTVLSGMIIHPLDAALSLLPYYRDLLADAPDTLGTILNLRLCPQMAAVPGHLLSTPIVAINLCWSGDIEEGQAYLHSLRGFGQPVLDTVTPMRYVDLQQMVDGTSPPEKHYYSRSVDFGRLSDEVIEIMVQHASRITSPLSAVPVYHLEWAVGRIPADDSAFGSRHAGHNINMFGAWEPDRPDRADMLPGSATSAWRWHPTLSDSMSTSSTTRDRTVCAAYGRRWQRLVALKRRVDPVNLFRYNFNIDPDRGD